MNKHLLSNLNFSAPLVKIHYRRPHIDSMLQLKSEHETIAVIRDLVNPDRIDLKEYFWVLLLSRANRLLGTAEICMGKLNCTTVDVREIFQLALLTNAAHIILVHNHPSGSLKPSESDIAITRKIAEFGKIIDVKILDHIIISSESHRSIPSVDYT